MWYPGRVYRAQDGECFSGKKEAASFFCEKMGALSFFQRETFFDIPRGGPTLFFQGEIGGEHFFWRKKGARTFLCFSGYPLRVQYRAMIAEEMSLSTGWSLLTMIFDKNGGLIAEELFPGPKVGHLG